MLRTLSHARRRLPAHLPLPHPLKPCPVPSQPLTPRFASRLPSRSFSSSILRRAIVPFKLHDIGEGITEVEMLSWKVVVGDRVEHFGELCEVQSDKSTAELTSPTPGIVHSINVQEGDTVKVGQTLCEIKTDDHVEDESGVDGSSSPGEGTATTAEEVSEPSLVDETKDHARPSPSGALERGPAVTDRSTTAHLTSTTEQTRAGFAPVNLDDTGVSGDPALSTGVQFSGEASILPPSPAPAMPHPMASWGETPVRQESPADGMAKKIVLASPAVRTLAGRLGIDLASVRGSGEKGRVTREDVEKHGTGMSGRTGSTAGAGPSASQMIEVGKRAEWAETTRVPFGRTRKVMYRALGGQAEVPHFGYSHTLNLTPLLPYLQSMNPATTPPSSSSAPKYLASDIPPSLVADPLSAAATAEKTTLLSFLVKAMLLAFEEHPIMRAKVIGKDGERALEIRRDGVIGVAVSDPKNGLLTPSLPPLAPSTPLSQITSSLSTLRQNPTKPSAHSANVVLSSVGGLGESTGAMPVLPPGGCLAICAVGRAKWEVEWVQRDLGMKGTAAEVERGGTEAVLRCGVGWSGDHRVLEGAELIAFTESWKKYIEEPWRWIGLGG